MTTDITELALITKIKNQLRNFDTIVLKEDEALALVEALEKAQQERENWRTSFDNERFRADKLKAHIDQMEPIRAAAEKLVRCKGRYHSEQNYRALAALFGVTTPDLPPLDSESRTVKMPEPFKLAKSSSGLTYYFADDVDTALAAAGIKWEAE